MSSLRDQIRGSVLGSSQQRKKQVVEFFGQQVEIRQPSLAEVMDVTSADDRKQQAVNMLIQYCYVPGEDTRVFEDADRDVLLNLPFGDDVVRMQQAISAITSIDVSKELGNSDATQQDSTS